MAKQETDHVTVDMFASSIDKSSYAGSIVNSEYAGQPKKNKSYLGAKSANGAYQAIIAAMPPHDIYIETHLGTGAIMLRKPACQKSIGVDVDQDMVEAFRHVWQKNEKNRYMELELMCQPCESLLARHDYDAGRTLIYADPPYLHETRTSKARYKNEYTKSQHATLLHLLKRAKEQGAMVMISGYPSAFYDESLPGWPSIEFQVMTRGGPRTEKLWMSHKFEKSHAADFAGKNFTDRQRIKRKAARWAANFKELPPQEKEAVFAAIMQTFAAG